MKRRSSIGFLVLVLPVFMVAAGGLLWQRQQTMAVRVQLEALRSSAGELAQLQGENRRLREKQISAAQLEALRADHAALPRLRAEIEALRLRSGSK